MYHVKEFLYLGDPTSKIKEEKESDPFYVTDTFNSGEDANNQKITIASNCKSAGGFLSIIYSDKQPNQPKNMSDELWVKVKWEKKWPLKMDVGESFIKGYKYEGMSITEFEGEKTTYETYILITQQN